MPHDFSPSLILARLVAVLIALFGASARCVRRVMGLRGRERRRFAFLAHVLGEHGRAVAGAGEDEAIVEARIARMAWIARDPVKALRHVMRGVRGFWRARLGGRVTPPAFAPPMLACAALSVGCDGFAPAPET